MAYNPNIVRDVLRARSLNHAQLSQRLDIPLAQLEQELRREPEPKQGILNEIAKELAVEPFVFFMEQAPPLHGRIPDFRSSQPAPTAQSRATIRSIQFAEGVQRTAARLDPSGASNLPHFTTMGRKAVDRFALKARTYFNISAQDQADAKDARGFYVICRQRIEDKGIFVLHDSFPAEDGSGFCLAHARHPVIVINTKQQTYGRRLFTLIHELAHVLMRKTGISDPFINENEIERICNRFAGSFLVPDAFIETLLAGVTPDQVPNLDDVRWASRRLKISQEATVVRLEQLGLYRAGSHENWKRIVHNLGNPDFGEKGGGGTEPPPQEKVKLAKYGFLFARTFSRLLRQGLITEINLYRSTGLKPKYLYAYFDYANSINSSELGSLELED